MLRKLACCILGIATLVIILPARGLSEKKVDEQPIRDIVEVLCPKADGLLDEVLSAAREPQQYLQMFSDELLERGIETPREVDYWLALIDGLARRGCLVESDWKNCGRDFAWQLGQLRATSAHGLDWSLLGNQGMDYKAADKFAPDIEKVLSPKRLALVFLNYSGDSYALSIVSSEKVPALKAAAKRLSQSIELFGRETGNNP